MKMWGYESNEKRQVLWTFNEVIDVFVYDNIFLIKITL